MKHPIGAIQAWVLSMNHKKVVFSNCGCYKEKGRLERPVALFYGVFYLGFLFN